MKRYCEFYDPDENGDICRASEEDGCPNYSDCTAEYDVHGNRLNETCDERCKKDVTSCELWDTEQCILHH